MHTSGLGTYSTAALPYRLWELIMAIIYPLPWPGSSSIPSSSKILTAAQPFAQQHQVGKEGWWGSLVAIPSFSHFQRGCVPRADTA